MMLHEDGKTLRTRAASLPGRGVRAAWRATPAIRASVEQVVAMAAVFWALSANQAFIGATLRGHGLADLSTWSYGLSMLLLVTALHAFILLLLANRWTMKPVLGVLVVGTAFATYFTGTYGVYLDPSMLRNVLHTDLPEARELVGMQLALHLVLYAVVPLLLLSRVRLVTRPLRSRRLLLRAFLRRGLLLGLSAMVMAGAVLLNFQAFSSLMRNQKEVRYLITPANYLWSLGVVVTESARGAARPRQAIGLDAHPGPSWQARRRPMVLVVVVGETARAANWGLSGYARQTAPQLAAIAPVNFQTVVACGTSTEVSLPCMFAPVGRRSYDEAAIRGQESLLDVLARAGVAVHWRDNQSGCKGLCDAHPGDRVSPLNAPGLCSEGRCLDEGLIQDMEQRLDAAEGTQVWFLHMLGNHGPSYFRRYPEAFARFQPDCREDDLRRCNVAQIVNAYDNALLYTDHVLASAIAKLKARAGKVDAALVYVSDHGESLGERGLFLHGMPYAIAPDVQTRVPMIMWFGDGFERASGLEAGCLLPALAQAARGTVAHDHLFHTVLGLLDVRTGIAEASLDLSRPCRRGPVASARAR
jgi:lipid A ethanolaminephosphotransferase